ncbi:MAG: hypothetical protein F4Z60_05620 [Chloroflexi bacterium]|nr:hypothetical protein [Chloroflexota bacterium]
MSGRNAEASPTAAETTSNGGATTSVAPERPSSCSHSTRLGPGCIVPSSNAANVKPNSLRSRPSSSTTVTTGTVSTRVSPSRGSGGSAVMSTASVWNTDTVSRTRSPSVALRGSRSTRMSTGASCARTTPAAANATTIAARIAARPTPRARRDTA